MDVPGIYVQGMYPKRTWDVLRLCLGRWVTIGASSGIGQNKPQKRAQAVYRTRPGRAWDAPGTCVRRARDQAHDLRT